MAPNLWNWKLKIKNHNFRIGVQNVKSVATVWLDGHFERIHQMQSCRHRQFSFRKCAHDFTVYLSIPRVFRTGPCGMRKRNSFPLTIASDTNISKQSRIKAWLNTDAVQLRFRLILISFSLSLSVSESLYFSFQNWNSKC